MIEGKISYEEFTKMLKKGIEESGCYWDGYNNGISKKENNLSQYRENLVFEKVSTSDIEKLENDIKQLLIYVNCFITAFPIGKLKGEIFSIHETNDTSKELINHLSNDKLLAIFSAKINDNKEIIYRYSLIDKPKLDRIKELEKRLTNSPNALLVDKGDFDSLKKITKSTPISEYEVETPNGWVNIEALHETIEYQVYELTLSNGKSLKCADNHIIINSNGEEVFIKNLKEGDEVETDEGISSVKTVIDLGYKEVMYDLELSEDSDRTYYTNGILSHNTYLSKVIAEHVFGDKEALIRVDMSEYMEKFSMTKLIGAPPGYVGYGEGGKLTEAVRRRPHSVILFDEIEKAHEDIFNLLLQLLDEGQLTDSNDRKIDFKNAIIIMTSNIGVKELSTFGKSIGYESKNSIINDDVREKNIIQKALKNKFNPEFLNRIDETIIFNSLTPEHINDIIKNEIDEVKERIEELNYKLVVNKSAMKYIADEGYHKEYGARPLKRAIQKYIEDPITDEVMNGNLNEGDTIKISYTIKDGIKTNVIKK